LQDTRYELTHDAKVESLEWVKATDGHGGFENDSEREETTLDEYNASHEQAQVVMPTKPHRQQMGILAILTRLS
jgi:hypothetical protein